MQREQIREILKGIFEEETDNCLATLDDQTRIVEEVGLDSVDIVSLLMRVERQFRIRITHNELVDMVTVGSLIDLIQAKVAEPAAAARAAA